MTMTSNKDVRATLRGTLEQQLDLVVPQASSRAAKRKAFLMVSTGPAAGMVFPVAQRSLLVGRSQEAEVQINEQAISHEHARLEQTEQGIVLRDLGSTNGTYVNGELVEDAVVLSGGDSIRMGSTTFTFVTREGVSPKGTVRLQALDPRQIERRREPESAHVVPASQQTGSLSLTDAVRKVRTCWVYARRYWRLLAVGAGFGLLMALLQLWLRPPPGSAWFELSLVPAHTASAEEAPQAFASAESTFRSLPLIKQTLKDLGAPSVSDGVATEIQANLTFEPIAYNSKVYHGEYQDSSAELALRFLNQHVHVYIESELDQLLTVLKADAAFDRAQEQKAYDRVAKARSELIAFTEQHPDAVPKDAKLPNVMQVRLPADASPERIEESMVAASHALRRAYMQIQSKKAQPYQQKVAQAEDKIAEAHARGLRDQHPEVVALRNLQATMRNRASAIMAAEPSPAEQELDPQIPRLKAELAELEARLSQLPGGATRSVKAALAGDTTTQVQASRPAQSLAQLALQYGELAREYENAKTQHEALLKKREATDRQLERERTSAAARYDIITPPTAAKASLFSSAVKRSALGICIGLGLAVMAAACLEMRRLLIARGHIQASA
jgi:pSer/pThr/pTyr-binding forkhead associated (FHA) protein